MRIRRPPCPEILARSRSYVVRQPNVRALLIDTHQSACSDDVRYQYRGQSYVSVVVDPSDHLTARKAGFKSNSNFWSLVIRCSAGGGIRRSLCDRLLVAAGSEGLDGYAVERLTAASGIGAGVAFRRGGGCGAGRGRRRRALA